MAFVNVTLSITDVHDSELLWQVKARPTYTLLVAMAFVTELSVVQLLPSEDRYAVKTFPMRTMRSQFGTDVPPPVKLLLTVLPAVLARLRTKIPAPPPRASRTLAWRESKLSVSRNMMPARGVVNVF